MSPATWLSIRVELLGGAGQVFDPPPGRDLLVGPRHTFADLADAINTAFARWDISRLHEFQLAGHRRIGKTDPDASDIEDEDLITVASVVRKDDEFVYVFDFGDDWRHACRVLDDAVDPVEALGEELPLTPVPIWGWGSIPDQYGRDRPNDESD